MFPNNEFKTNIFKEPLMAPKGRWDRGQFIECVPDPRTDANDCEALIRRLNEQGYEVDVLHWRENDAAVLFRRSIETHETRYYDEITVADWKHGVCDLAEKVIDSIRKTSKES